jgi:hypothetical protein
MLVFSGGASFRTESSITLERREAELWLWMARSTDILITAWEESATAEEEVGCSAADTVTGFF